MPIAFLFIFAIIFMNIIAISIPMLSGWQADIEPSGNYYIDGSQIAYDYSDHVEASDQPAGDTIHYKNLNLTKNGFAVVRKKDEDSDSGEIIGTKYVKKGFYDTGSIKLDEATQEGELYWLELYEDVNKNGNFDERGFLVEEADQEVVTEDGVFVRVPIIAKNNIKETKDASI